MTDELLLRHQLLQAYSRLGEQGPSLERTALRGESVQMRQIFAHAATGGRLDLAQLSQKLLAHQLRIDDVDPNWLARLATVVGLQDSEPEDTSVGIAALQLAAPHTGRKASVRYHKLLAELLFEERRYRELDDLLAQERPVRLFFHRYLGVDSRSPFVRAGQDQKRWLAGFNLQFTQSGLLPVTLRSGSEVPFNRLTVRQAVRQDVTQTREQNDDAADAGAPTREPEPLVTVIMTTYRPVEADAVQSAQSILDQTWQNLELLIVDDASDQQDHRTLERLEQLDPRVRMIRLETNGGTYAARNVGIAQARGQFVTGQDADDWSHPQRIQIQVEDLLRHPELPGNQVFTVNMTEDLVRIRRGYHPFIPSAPTLMVRTPIMRELGGYLPARKAADNEMRGRVAAYTGEAVHAIRLPLIFMRILSSSLSRADFRAGWQHPARRMFWSAYKTWHAEARLEQLRRSRNDPPPVHIPARFTQPPSAGSQLDVVLAADWCESGLLQADMLEEIRTLREAGSSVGVLHMESPLHPSEHARALYRPVQELISAGEVACVLPDEDFHHVRLLVIRAAELLQFMPRGQAAFTIDQLAVVAEGPPASPGGERATYLAQDCVDHAEHYFGRRPVWAAASGQIRNRLLEQLPKDQVLSKIHSSPFEAGERRVKRDRRRANRLVVGAWGGSHVEDWPEDPAAVAALLPVDGSVDVRLYGHPATLLRAADAPQQPAHWLAFTPGRISRSTYYRSLDAFLYYPQQAPAIPQRSVCEALAAGCLVALPPKLRDIYGEAALYAEPQEAIRLLETVLRDRTVWAAQCRRAADFAHHVGGGDYLAVLEALQDHPAHPTQEILAP